MKDGVMDFNHELRFVGFWKSKNERRSVIAVRRMRGRERRTGLEDFSSETVLRRPRSGDFDEVRWKLILNGSFSL